MKKQRSRRVFLSNSIKLGIGANLFYSHSFGFIPAVERPLSNPIFSLQKGERQLFVDDLMIGRIQNISRKIHSASKLERPVLVAEKPWEQGNIYDGGLDKRVYIYGTVLYEKNSQSFRMWYNRIRNNYYAISQDGINWERPNLGLLGNNNMIDLHDFHSPSFIKDDQEKDPSKRYKAVGSTRKGYFAAYSADGLNWKLYPKNPILNSGDTITLSQDPKTGEYLVFHKIHDDPRTKPIARQIYLSVSKDMQNWSEPDLVMIADETDHEQARRLDGGLHSEFYNMSAFPYAGQWIGMITVFRRTGTPKIHKGRDWGQSPDDGPINVQLVHSRDGRKWERCSDRTPIIPLGPEHYDSGSILGLCNAPVIVGDEIWMYYTAMTTTHGGYLPDKQMSIARAAWRIDGFVSLHAGNIEGIIETTPITTESGRLYINANVPKGKLQVEVLE